MDTNNSSLQEPKNSDSTVLSHKFLDKETIDLLAGSEIKESVI
jgi:hypothetical protein